MDRNNEFLNYIHQNSEMGEATITQLLGIAKDQSYKTMLQSQLNEYTMIRNAADEKLKAYNKEPKGINPLTKASSYIMINFNTIADKTPSHISEMMIRGSTMGVIDITKKIKEYADADNEIVDLANKLLSFEQRNIEECKKFLQ